MHAGATVSLNEKLGGGSEGGGAWLVNYHDPHTLRWLDGPGEDDDADEDDADADDGDDLDDDDEYGGGGPSNTTILTLSVGWTGRAWRRSS